jgi:hypothetical protein
MNRFQMAGIYSHFKNRFYARPGVYVNSIFRCAAPNHLKLFRSYNYSGALPLFNTIYLNGIQSSGMR